MTMVAQLELIEERMEKAFERRRFDTLVQLMAERFRIIRMAMQTPERAAVLSLAERLGDRWTTRLDEELGQSRKQQAMVRERMRQQNRSGRMIRRAL